jgi:hypothetical protein
MQKWSVPLLITSHEATDDGTISREEAALRRETRLLQLVALAARPPTGWEKVPNQKSETRVKLLSTKARPPPISSL